MVDKKFAEEALKAHNEYRSRHKASSLKHNKDISSIAQRWADHLASTGSFQHSPDRSYKGEKMGENIAMKWTSGGDDFTGQQVTNQWYSEVEKYNFSAGSGGGTGHFTQVVWKGSREFGIGRAQGRDGKWIVVANYLPAGNFLGRYAENVSAPKDGKKTLIGGDTAGKDKGGAGASNFFSHFKPSGSDRESPKSFDHGFSRSHGFNDSAPSASGGRVISKETKTFTEGYGANKKVKTVVTETIQEPDGSKKTVTRETVEIGEGGRPSSSSSSSSSSDFLHSNRGINVRLMSNPTPDRRWPPSKYGVEESAAVRKPIGREETKPQKTKDFIDDVVKIHNKYRKLHGKVGDVKHNKDLSVQAQRWAEHLASTTTLAHSNDKYRGEELGENVASKWSSAGADYTGEQAVDQWYSEISKYDFYQGDFKPGTGHFTQVVWKGSREMGIGKAYSADRNRVFVVCNYYPAGNVLGRFRENVFPPSK